MSREEFEKWAEAQGYAIDQFGDDHGDRYRDEKTLRAWGAWQACQPEIDALRSAYNTEAMIASMAREESKALEAERDQLRARVAELEGNDRRYRWLRDDHKGTSPHMDGTMVWIRTGRNVLRGQTLDSAIDKAMGKPKSEAPPAPMVPEGWKLVPIEPTDEMIEVGCDVANAYRVDIARAYEAMLAAAPEVKS